MTKNKSKLIARIILLVSTVISLFFVPYSIVWAWILPLPNTVQEQLDEALSHGFEGIIVYADKGGKQIAYNASGWHNRDEKIPAYPEALFKIASISKLYDATAITKLVGAGTLSLDKTLADYFPEYAQSIEYADRITLRMMVQHKSGIPNFTNTPNFWNIEHESAEAVLSLIFDMPASFEPGEGYEYSNTNYLLLSMLIEKVTGKSKFVFIKEAILMPLGLNNTYGSIQDIDMNRLMSGYYIGVEGDIKTTDYASMLATAEDVAVFLRALNDGSLLNEEEQKIYASIYVFDHTGLIPGYQSIAEYHEDLDMVVIQFTNTTKFDGYLWNLSQVVYNRVVKILKKEVAQ